MINTYTHYGSEVKRQIIGTSFIDTLIKNDIVFTELPLLDSHVIKYTTEDGNTIFALIVPQNLPDDYAETVYLTKSVPDDGDWNKLRSDIEAQHGGAEPERMESRTKLLIDYAYNKAYEILAPQYPSNDWMLSPEIPEAELIKNIVLILIHMGIGAKDLEQGNSWDVDPAWLNKIIAAF